MTAKGKSSYTPVEILSLEGSHVAEASSTCEVGSDPRMGIGPWRGQLFAIEPQGAVEPGREYRIRLPDGREGAIIIRRLRHSPSVPPTVAFVGKGPPPGAPRQT